MKQLLKLVPNTLLRVFYVFLRLFYGVGSREITFYSGFLNVCRIQRHCLLTLDHLGISLSHVGHPFISTPVPVQELLENRCLPLLTVFAAM